MAINPVQILIDEHRVILQVTAAWEMADQAIEHGAAFPAAFVSRVVDFIHAFADAYHHHREEELFIPYVEHVSSDRARGNIGLVRQEHQMARYRARRADELLPAAAAGDVEAQKEIRRLLNSYCSLISCHIGMEDMAFFPNGYATMSPQLRARVQQAFQEFDANKENQETNKRYRALAERIVAQAREMHNDLKHHTV
ncbi:MAG: Hemerythrin HHE cation binding domain protein [candidate division BRC1 bacterium ADurb.BinA292]|nr:MAG: Hemerythrin HHE cation binding domain protein [candidate division BRC1 bacterium ADurb.BinA292]HOR29508.1 hemerythrin domain-containing protein [Candidatus Sumerlaeota bacterium]